MRVKPVLVFTTQAKIRSGSAVQDSEVPGYSHTHSQLMGLSKTSLLMTSSIKLRMLQHRAEELKPKVPPNALWLPPSRCFSKVEEEKHSWHGAGARKRLSNKRGAAQTAEWRNGDIQ